MDKLKESADFLAFEKGKLTIHVRNANDYLMLIRYLTEHSVTDPEFPLTMNGYDPRFSYFYMGGSGSSRELSAYANFKEILFEYPFNNRCIEYEFADFASDMATAQAELILSSMNTTVKGQLYQML